MYGIILLDYQTNINMPKQFIKKYLPSDEKIRSHKHLRIFGEYLFKSQIWNLNRYTAPRAFAVGVFCAFLPIPFQMVVAAAIAIPVHANLPLSVALVWLTNPITIPPVFYFCYRVGVLITGSTAIKTSEISLSVSWFSEQFSLIWYPLLTGSLLCGCICSAISFYSIKALWKIQVAKKWKNRNYKPI
jgi:uncharacterized protein (DUF2062 family)